MVKRIGIIIVGATLVVAHCLIGGAAFAQGQAQENGQPCPPECTIDSMEIVTWYPSPYNSYEELYSMRLGVGDVSTLAGEAEFRPKKLGSIKVAESVVFKPKDGDPQAWSWVDAEQGEMAYSSQADAFYHYNGSSWITQTSSGGKVIIQTFCPWRNDFREGGFDTGFASNWGKDKNGSGFYPCDPPSCPTGWTDLGIIGSEPLSVACFGNANCHWGSPDNSYHPVSSGRVVRACRES